MLGFPEDTMTVTVVYDNSEATELCAAQHLYLKPIAKLMINVLLPESTEPMRPFSNWEVLDQLKSLICPDQFTTVRLSKSTKNFIRFEGEAETQSLVQILKAKLHGKIIKLNGLKTDLKVVATDAQGEWEHLPQGQEAPSSDGVDELDCNKSPHSIHFQGLPCKWFAPKGSSGEKPCEEILRVVFESFGKIKNVDIPMLDPYREVMTGRSFGGFSFGLQTFEAFIQYHESTDFIKAMESLRGMKLMLKGDDGKALACNIKVTFDTTKHFSEGAIRRRNQERLKLQELEEERRKEKKREEEEAERKRKEEERKAQEKRKKARVRKRALKERDRHRQRKRDRAKAEATREPNSSEEWEERKFLLAQRRVEAVWLLLVLLRKIAESTQFNPQEVEVAGHKAKYGLGNTLGTLKKEELNTQHLRNQEEMPRYRVANKRKQKKKKRTQLRKSSHYHWRKNREYSVRKEKTGKLLTNVYNHSFFDQNTLQISLIKDEPLEKEDHLNSNEYYPSKFSERGHDRKDKIYETYDFIDFPLNHYYQTPEYPSSCLEPSHPISTCQWQRSVHAKGNGFQVNLRKCNCHSTTLSQTQKLQWREKVQEDDYWANSHTQDLVHKPQKRAKVNYAKECSKEFKNHHKDTVSEAHDELTPTDGKCCLLEKTYAYQARDSKSRSQSQVSSFRKSANLKLEFTDFLEEVSSDSEQFSETLTINKEEKEKSMATYESTAKGGSLDTDEVITYNQQIRSSQPTLYSKWKHFGEEKFSKHQLGKPSKRSKYEQRCSWHEDENNAMRAKNSNSKKEEKLAPKYLFYQGNYHKSTSSDVLDNSTRKKSKFSDNTFDQKINYRPFNVPTTSSQCANAFYSMCFPQRREFMQKSEYNQDVRMFKRHENSTDFLPTLDDYHIRCSSQEHVDCGSYNLRNNYTSSIYFQMF